MRPGRCLFMVYSASVDHRKGFEPLVLSMESVHPSAARRKRFCTNKLRKRLFARFRLRMS